MRNWYVYIYLWFRMLLYSDNKQEGEAEELTSQLDRLKKEERERLKKIAGLETEIERTQTELARLSQIELENTEDLRTEAVCDNFRSILCFLMPLNHREESRRSVKT